MRVGIVRPAIYKQDLGAEVLTPERCSILESYNLATDPELSIARARVAPGVTTLWHLVKSTVERYLIAEGSGRVEVEGLPPTEVLAGDIVVIPPDTPQRISNTGSHDLIFFCICTPRFEARNFQVLEAGTG